MYRTKTTITSPEKNEIDSMKKRVTQDTKGENTCSKNPKNECRDRMHMHTGAAFAANFLAAGRPTASKDEVHGN